VGNVVLGLLMLSPMTLYLLNKQFEQSLALIYSASLGSIRTAVLGLLDRGLVTVEDSIENGRSKKTYLISDTGRAAFLEWMLAPIESRDLETQALARLFFLGLVPAAERRAIVDGILTRAEADTAQLAGLSAHLDGMDVPEPFAEVFRYQRATLDYGLRSHRAGLEYFRELRRTLDDD
jgi:DNA-binding PadR family transcriptional regulator